MPDLGARPKKDQVNARLIVRRVCDANPAHLVPDAQGELFAPWRHHAVFADSPLPMLEAMAAHRRHAIIEQVIADLTAGPLAHLPSGWFAANFAWLVLTAIAFNPDPHRRLLGLAVARQSDHGHHLAAAAHRPGPHHPLSPPADPATIEKLALGRLASQASRLGSPGVRAGAR